MTVKPVEICDLLLPLDFLILLSCVCEGTTFEGNVRGRKGLTTWEINGRGAGIGTRGAAGEDSSGIRTISGTINGTGGQVRVTGRRAFGDSRSSHDNARIANGQGRVYGSGTTEGMQAMYVTPCVCVCVCFSD